MSEEINAMDVFKYGLIAYTLNGPKSDPYVTVVHFCGYMHTPTKTDIKALEEELNTDPEFGLCGKINNGVFIMVASPEQVEFYTGPVSKKNKVRIDKEE